jgi:hypothetical protein
MQVCEPPEPLQKYVLVPVSMMDPSPDPDEKADLGGCWAMFTVVVWPALTDLYTAAYVCPLPDLMVAAKFLRLFAVGGLPPANAGTADPSSKSPTVAAATPDSTRVFMPVRYGCCRSASII